MLKIKKLLFVILGFLSLALGIVGIVLPILPTVPFLLLTSYCFVKGSERFDKWFKSTKIYKNHLEEFVNNRSMTLSQKLTILATATTMMAFPFFMTDMLWLRIFIIFMLCCAYSYFYFAIKTIKK